MLLSKSVAEIFAVDRHFRDFVGVCGLSQFCFVLTGMRGMQVVCMVKCLHLCNHYRITTSCLKSTLKLSACNYSATYPDNFWKNILVLQNIKNKRGCSCLSAMGYSHPSTKLNIRHFYFHQIILYTYAFTAKILITYLLDYFH